MPRPGVQGGVRVGTGQRDTRVTPNTLTGEMEKEEDKTKNKEREQSITQ